MAAAYTNCEFHVGYQRLSQFIAVELSSVYHDVIKDRMYTDPAGSLRRRSTQTTLHRLVTGLCQMLSPVLAFTADEAWEFIPGKAASSVHLSEWEPAAFNLKPEEAVEWQHLFRLRERALPELEKARQSKHIGKALEARVSFAGPASELRTHHQCGQGRRRQMRALLALGDRCGRERHASDPVRTLRGSSFLRSPGHFFRHVQFPRRPHRVHPGKRAAGGEVHSPAPALRVDPADRRRPGLR
ncbi:MAG: class I tRNA ligase family protein [Verrucomicrobia bacterium]|nr:class I tRNA ligase family protein [Verrucomicrobiota bacterium]